MFYNIGSRSPFYKTFYDNNSLFTVLGKLECLSLTVAFTIAGMARAYPIGAPYKVPL